MVNINLKVSPEQVLQFLSEVLVEFNDNLTLNFTELYKYMKDRNMDGSAIAFKIAKSIEMYDYYKAQQEQKQKPIII